MQVQPQVALPKIMFARYYGSKTNRFLSVDPVSGSSRDPQSWNRYTYVQNNPILFIDPNGEDLYVAYDFGDTNLSDQQKSRVTRRIQKAFNKAGVKNVHMLPAGDKRIPGQLRKHDKVAKVTFKNKVSRISVAQGYKRVDLLGVTPPPFEKSEVSTARASEEMTQITNTAVHEIGHQILPGGNTQQHHASAAAGSVMEDVATEDAEVLDASEREFDSSDAAALRERLNEPESKK